MNHYETVFIATPVLSDVQTKEAVRANSSGVITENGGQIVSDEDWGLQQARLPDPEKDHRLLLT